MQCLSKSELLLFAELVKTLGALAAHAEWNIESILSQEVADLKPNREAFLAKIRPIAKGEYDLLEVDDVCDFLAQKLREQAQQTDEDGEQNLVIIPSQYEFYYRDMFTIARLEDGYHVAAISGHQRVPKELIWPYSTPQEAATHAIAWVDRELETEAQERDSLIAKIDLHDLTTEQLKALAQKQ